MVREKVKKNAPWFIYSFQDLIDALEQDSLQIPENGAIPLHNEEIKVEAS